MVKNDTIDHDVTAGVIYFVTSKSWRMFHYGMAVKSVQSLKQHMPWLETLLFTNIEKITTEHFDRVIYTGYPEKMWVYKWECLQKSPFDYTLHLDADTYICSDFSEVFEMMKRFDLVTCLSPHYGLDEKIPGVPSCYPEPAGGFLLWRKNKETSRWIDRTLQLLRARRRFFRADEPTIRQSMFESDMQIGIIPWEYTCVYGVPGYLESKVKIMHGHAPEIEKDAEIFNSVDGRRIYDGGLLYKLRITHGRYVELAETIPYAYRRGEKSTEFPVVYKDERKKR